MHDEWYDKPSFGRTVCHISAVSSPRTIDSEVDVRQWSSNSNSLRFSFEILRLSSKLVKSWSKQKWFRIGDGVWYVFVLGFDGTGYSSRRGTRGWGSGQINGVEGVYWHLRSRFVQLVHSGCCSHCAQSSQQRAIEYDKCACSLTGPKDTIFAYLNS
jgi:hypothetical protein